MLNYDKEIGNFSKNFKAIGYNFKVQKPIFISQSGGKQNLETNVYMIKKKMYSYHFYPKLSIDPNQV